MIQSKPKCLQCSEHFGIFQQLKNSSWDHTQIHESKQLNLKFSCRNKRDKHPKKHVFSYVCICTYGNLSVRINIRAYTTDQQYENHIEEKDIFIVKMMLEGDFRCFWHTCLINKSHLSDFKTLLYRYMCVYIQNIRIPHCLKGCLKQNLKKIITIVGMCWKASWLLNQR